jgi:diguanylate cyclase (GGDEF)-like protein
MVKNFKILVIHDNDPEYKIIKTILGYIFLKNLEIIRCKSWDDGIDQLKRDDFDFCLLSDPLADRPAIDLITAVSLQNTKIPLMMVTDDEDCIHKSKIITEDGIHFISKKDIKIHSLNEVIRYSIERKRIIHRMIELTQRDIVTGLPERSFLWSKLGEILQNAQRKNTYAGVLLIDINNLKEINQKVGYSGGDELLKITASKIQEILWEMDYALRFKGDQFVVIANNINKPEDIHVVTKKILKSLSNSSEINGVTILPKVNVGISILPLDGEDTDEIVSNSTTALNNAKSAGENNYHYYNEDLSQKIKKRDKVENSIKTSLENENFLLMLQPKINVQNDTVCGAEALVRMKTQDGKIVSPVHFIPIAEDSDLINKIGDWVLRQAHLQSIALKKSGIDDVPISVNISDAQFKKGAALLSVLKNLLSETDGMTSDLILEISEKNIVNDVKLSTALLDEIRKLGFQISIDNFGTEFSNLTTLKDLNINEIKIDRSFIKNVPNDVKSTALLKSITMLVKSLGYRAVILGVEKIEQYNLLKEHGCDEFQGFYISEARTYVDFVEWYNTYNKSIK